MSPTPTRQPGWTCICGTWNDSSRTQCISCKGPASELTPTEMPIRIPGDGVWFVDLPGGGHLATAGSA